jgi:tetratricopeptide (TPR) repeat protein
MELSREQGVGEQLARLLHNLANRLSDLGRLEAALAASEEAVELYRYLAASHPDVFLPELASSLNNLFAHLNALGKWEAPAAIEEAVELYRDLAASRPDAFRPDLAMSLNSLSTGLRSLGRLEAALAASEEAVEFYRDLAASRPGAFRPDLAVSLHNLSVVLSALARLEAALVAIEEAVELYRDLAASRPDAFRPDLAMSLNNLSNRETLRTLDKPVLKDVVGGLTQRRDQCGPRPVVVRWSPAEAGPPVAVLEVIANRR